MIKSNILACIPARSGSKRMPRKNTLDIEPGVSLVQHAINCAKWSGLIDHVHVISDDPYMSRFFHGAQLFCERAEHAGDHCDMVHAVADCAESLTKTLGPFSHVVTLQPAVVARSPLIVRRMIEKVLEEGAGGAVTMARTVPWQWKLKGQHAGNSWTPGPYPRSQDAGDFFAEVNAVQIAAIECVMAHHRWGLPLIIAELPQWAAALDIDEPHDLWRARDMWSFAASRLETWDPPLHFVRAINGDEDD